jgi:hypothetical protein
MASPRLGGSGIGLPNPLNNLTPIQNGNSAQTVPVNQSLNYMRSNQITLPAGEIFQIPAGTFLVTVGAYSFIQYLDPVSTRWISYDTMQNKTVQITSDGGNYRLANLTGTPIGANITNAGSGYTNGVGTSATGLTITASAGSSVWTPVVGGAVATTAVSAAAGTNYTYPPQVIVDAPPAGGIQATATCTISSGGVNAVTITNQGAGYSSAPLLTFLNDYRDSTGAGASWTTTLTGSGTLTALYPSNPGTAVTAVPTFTFSPASSTAATAVMNFSVTGYTVTAAGTTYTAPVVVGSAAEIVGGTSILTNPASTTGLTLPRPARILAAINTTTLTAVGYTVVDGGLGIQTKPTATITTAAYPTSANSAALVLTVGGNTDTCFIQPF